MTERKAFKRRIRAQMTETGQSYAQAAAELEAGNPARRPGTHPASALVVALLKASGLTLDPVAAYGVGGGIGFMYALFRYREVPHPLITIVCQHHPEPWAPAILGRLGVAHVAATGLRDARRLLDSARPVILPVTRGTLPWLTQEPWAAREEHVVLALPDQGGDDDRVRIFDGTGASAELSRGALDEGYAATARKHPVIALEEDARLPGDLRPAIEAGVAATVAGMTEPVLGNSFDVNFGLSGLRRWADRIADRGREGWASQFGDCDVWRERLVECIDREHTAPAAGRPLFARVLRSIGRADAAAHFERSGAAWRRIADGWAAGTLTLPELAEEVEEVLAAETAGLELLAGR